MQHAVLAAFLVVEDELDGDARAAGPLGVRRAAAVAGEVARIGGVRHRWARLWSSVAGAGMRARPGVNCRHGRRAARPDCAQWRRHGGSFAIVAMRGPHSREYQGDSVAMRSGSSSRRNADNGDRSNPHGARMPARRWRKAKGQAMPESRTGSNGGGIRFVLDGKVLTVDGVAPTQSVLNFLREDLGRTGTKEGCAEGDCGACTVVIGELAGDGVALQDGQRVHPVRAGARRQGAVHRRGPAAAGRRAAPGAAGDGRLPRLAMRLLHAGLRDVAVGALPRAPGAADRARPTREIRSALTGNLCRCTGYRPILDAGERMFDLPPACRSIAPRCAGSCSRSRATVRSSTSTTVAGSSRRARWPS